jgi:aspartate/glutamate racemase
MWRKSRGGIGPESTIEYYRAIIAAYRERADQLSFDHHQQHQRENSVGADGQERSG